MSERIDYRENNEQKFSKPFWFPRSKAYILISNCEISRMGCPYWNGVDLQYQHGSSISCYFS